MPAPTFIVCSGPRPLPPHQWIEAAALACEYCPSNAPHMPHLPEILAPGVAIPEAIAVLTTKYWGPQPRTLTVSFLEPTSRELADRILKNMNAWYERGFGIKFAGVQGRRGDVRITRAMGGYWSYLGTDIRLTPMDEPTMSLQGFSLDTPDSEYRRVVRHETWHTAGGPHEHMRRALIARLLRDAVIARLEREQGWTEQMIVQQVFTPLEESSLLVPPGGPLPPADQTSIACYQFAPEDTIDGLGIPGGLDINEADAAYARKICPRPDWPTAPTGPTPTPTPTPTSPPTPAPDPVAAQLLELHNAARARSGLAPYRLDDRLTAAAAAHADRMATLDTMSHFGIGDGTVLDRIEAAGYPFGGEAAENIGEGEISPDEVVAAWMSSSGHRANVLSVRFRDMGGALRRSPSGHPYWCTVFSYPR